MSVATNLTNNSTQLVRTNNWSGVNSSTSSPTSTNNPNPSMSITAPIMPSSSSVTH